MKSPQAFLTTTIIVNARRATRRRTREMAMASKSGNAPTSMIAQFTISVRAWGLVRIYSLLTLAFVTQGMNLPISLESLQTT